MPEQAMACRGQYLSRMGLLLRARRDISLQLLDTLGARGASSSAQVRCQACACAPAPAHPSSFNLRAAQLLQMAVLARGTFTSRRRRWGGTHACMLPGVWRTACSRCVRRSRGDV